MVQRLIVLLLLALGAWWLLTEGKPWLERTVGGFGDDLRPAVDMGADPEDILCLRAARDALDGLAADIGALPPPPRGRGAWDSTRFAAQDRISDAETTCRCASPSCSTARDALAELRATIDQMDALVRGDGTGIGNPANRLERAERLLDQARELAGR